MNTTVIFCLFIFLLIIITTCYIHIFIVALGTLSLFCLYVTSLPVYKNKCKIKKKKLKRMKDIGRYATPWAAHPSFPIRALLLVYTSSKD